jgi:hypothetical protein
MTIKHTDLPLIDYIFIVDPLEGDGLEVIDALKSPRTEALGNGLPRLGVSASDHVPLAVILAPQEKPASQEK